MTLTIPALEAGRVRVFALSMSEGSAQKLRETFDPGVLGLTTLNANYVEIFPIADLDEIGLIGYLENGCGVERKQLDPDRAKLAQLDGWVMLVFSNAFGNMSVELAPAPELTLIGTYSEPGVDWSDAAPLVSESATTSASPTRKTPSDAAMSGRIATLVLIVIFALTGVLVWIAA